MAKGVGGKTKLKFKTTKRMNADKKRIWISVFVIIVLIIAAASLATYLKERPDSDSDGKPNDGITVQPANMKEYVNLLFAGTKTDSGEILILTHITINTKDKSFVITPLPSSKIDSVKAADITKEVSEKFNLDIDRYVLVTEKKFKTFSGAMGLYEVNIKNKIDFSGDDFSLNLLPGPQKLSGDNFFKYLRYMGSGETDYDLEKQGNVIADYLQQKINITNAEKGDELFSDMINSAESDVTIVDFQKYHDFLSNVSKGTKKDIKVRLSSAKE